MKHGHNGVELLEMEDADGEEPPHELTLALAVVTAALHDIRMGERTQRAYQSDSLYAREQRAVQDAMDFLLRRLNDDTNIWGNQLRAWGSKPLTRTRLARLVRERVKINEDTDARLY